MTEEKRRHPRIYRRFILRAAVSGENPLRWSFVTIHNLSADGVFFTYDRPVREGAQLYFKIDFPDRVIECMGRVVRVGGLREGICRDVAARLESVGAEHQRFLEDFVSRSLNP